MQFKAIPLLEPQTLNRTLLKISEAQVFSKCADFREAFDKIPDHSLGCVLADPPWPYAGDKFRGEIVLPYPVLQSKDISMLFAEVCRSLKPDRNVWVWSDWLNVPYVIRRAESFGLHYFGLLVAKRKRVGLGWHVRKNCYFIVGLATGKPQVRSHLEEYLGEWEFFGSKKPWAIAVQLLRHSLPPGERWFDPFPAAHEEVPRRLRAGQAVELSVLFKKSYARVLGRRRIVPQSL